MEEFPKAVPDRDTTEEFSKAVPDSLASTFRVHGLDSNPATSIFEAEV